MPSFETLLRVFVASPGDLVEERAALEDVIRELNLTWSKNLGIRLELVRWETHTHPQIGEDPQMVINAQIGGDYDIFVGILWARFGTPTPRAASGTLEEFEQAVTKYRSDPNSVRVMFYFKDAPLPPSKLDPAQLQMVKGFRERLGNEGLYSEYKDPHEFASLARIHLSRLVQEWQKTWGVGTTKPVTAVPPAGPATSVEEEEVDEGFLDLLEVTEDRVNGLVQVTDRIANATTGLGHKMAERTAELHAAKRPGGEPDFKEYKRVSNRSAEDMELYVSQMEAEIPTFAKLYSGAMDAFGRAASLVVDFKGYEASGIESALTTIRTLRSALAQPVGNIKEYRETVAALPRVTIQFNRAKRKTVAVLDRFLGEIENALNLTTEVEQVLQNLLQSQDRKV